MMYRMDKKTEIPSRQAERLEDHLLSEVRFIETSWTRDDLLHFERDCTRLDARDRGR
jgi:hypothetical protein